MRLWEQSNDQMQVFLHHHSIRCHIKSFKSTHLSSMLSWIYFQLHVCWSTSVEPPSQKFAAISLIGKKSAIEDPELLSNLRPIPLTSCVGNLFTNIMKNRWLEFIPENGTLTRQLKRSSSLPLQDTSRTKQRWLLSSKMQGKNTITSCVLVRSRQCTWQCPSITHRIPSETLSLLQAMVQSLYSNLSISVTTGNWSTPAIPLQIGVYQGDPLSVAVFNTVIQHTGGLPKEPCTAELLSCSQTYCHVYCSRLITPAQWQRDMLHARSCLTRRNNGSNSPP